jgi:hypothetical protein
LEVVSPPPHQPLTNATPGEAKKAAFKKLSKKEPSSRYNRRRSYCDARAKEKAMPMHDWTRVEAGIFHAFHHEWVSELSRALNRGLLPSTYYALPEQVAAGFGPDVLTLQDTRLGEDEPEGGGVTTATAAARPMVAIVPRSR